MPHLDIAQHRNGVFAEWLGNVFVAIAAIHAIFNPGRVQIIEGEGFGAFFSSALMIASTSAWASILAATLLARGSMPALTKSRALSRSSRIAAISLVG